MEYYRYQGPSDLRNDVIMAQSAIVHYVKSDVRNWFQKLLDILKVGKFARIQLYTKRDWNYDDYDHKEDFTDFVDVARISNTSDYASFYDLLNHSSYINYDFDPIEIDELKYELRTFYEIYSKI